MTVHTGTSLVSSLGSVLMSDMAMILDAAIVEAKNSNIDSGYLLNIY